jgi:hypothetical protein
MLKIIFLIVIVIGFIAYTGIDVTSEYQAISDVRSQIFKNIIDPIAKKVLTFAAESNFDITIEEFR